MLIGARPAGRVVADTTGRGMIAQRGAPGAWES